MPERASTTKPRSRGAGRLLRRHPSAHLLRVRLVHHESGKTDKIPVEAAGYNRRRISDFQVRFYSRRLYGFFPGSLSLICVDVDRGGLTAVEAVCRALGADPVAVIPTCREGGYHIYFRWAGDIEVRNWKWCLPEGSGELRGHSGWAVLWGNASDALVKGLDRADQCRPVTPEKLDLILPWGRTDTTTSSSIGRSKEPHRGYWRDAPTGTRRDTLLSMAGSELRQKGKWNWTYEQRLEFVERNAGRFHDQTGHPFPEEGQAERIALYLHDQIEREKASGHLQRNWDAIHAEKVNKGVQARRAKLWGNPAYREACAINTRERAQSGAKRARIIEEATGICHTRQFWNYRLRCPLLQPVPVEPWKTTVCQGAGTLPLTISYPSKLSKLPSSACRKPKPRIQRGCKGKKYKPDRLYWWHVWRRKRRGEISNQNVGRFLNRKRRHGVT